MGEIPHAPQTTASATAAICPVGSLIALAAPVLESGFARSGPAALRAENEALRVLSQGVQHPVEDARLALQLVDQRVDARQRLVAEGVRRNADLFQALS